MSAHVVPAGSVFAVRCETCGWNDVRRLREDAERDAQGHICGPLHGTQKGYQWHHRHGVPVCEPCREANNAYQRLTKTPAPHCRVCKQEIEAVLPVGVFGEWMHTETRRERAEDGHLAQPFTLPREEAS